MKPIFYNAVLTSAIMLSVCSCVHRDVDLSSDLKFAVLNGTTNFIKDIATQKQVPICLALIGFTAEEYESKAQFAEAVLNTTANEWATALSSLPNFPVRDMLPVNIRRQPLNQLCPGFSVVKGNDGNDELSVHWYADAQLAFQQTCATWGATYEQCASGGDPWYKRIIFNPANRGVLVAEDQITPTILHEFGHTLGLGDLYSSVVDVPAVMNIVWVTPHPTDDDKLGLAAATRLALTGEQSCRGLGQAVLSNDGRAQIYCSPATDYREAMSILASQHGSVGNNDGFLTITDQFPAEYNEVSFGVGILQCENDPSRVHDWGANTGAAHQYWFTAWCGHFTARFRAPNP